jgi:hypothetical protein
MQLEQMNRLKWISTSLLPVVADCGKYVITNSRGSHAWHKCVQKESLAPLLPFASPLLIPERRLPLLALAMGLITRGLSSSGPAASELNCLLSSIYAVLRTVLMP